MTIKSVEAKGRKRYPQQYLLYEARRYYADKESEFIKGRIGRLLARIIAADMTLQDRGEGLFPPGMRQALVLAYKANIPAEKRLPRRADGKAQD